MGVFVHAVDIATGESIWTNSGSGSDYLVQQHNSPAFAGVAPQGALRQGRFRDRSSQSSAFFEAEGSLFCASFFSASFFSVLGVYLEAEPLPEDLRL